MTTGLIQRLYTDKGFGFLRNPDTGEEFFFHRSVVKGARFDDLREQQTVQFEAGQGPKGPRADSVYVA